MDDTLTAKIFEMFNEISKISNEVSFFLNFFCQWYSEISNEMGYQMQ